MNVYIIFICQKMVAQHNGFFIDSNEIRKNLEKYNKKKKNITKIQIGFAISVIVRLIGSMYIK